MTSVSGSGERILAILDLFTGDKPQWSPEEMMGALGYTRPTLYRYLKTLKDAGYLAALSQAVYTLGPRVTELDFLMQRADPLIEASQLHLTNLAARFQGSAFIVRWYGRKLLCVASASANAKPRSSYPRGRPMPLGRGAISRAIVAFLPLRDRSTLIDEHLNEFIIPDVCSDKGEVLGQLKQVKREGVAVARGEVTPGLLGVASPVFAADTTPIASLCVSCDETLVDNEELEKLREAVRHASQEISSVLAPFSTRQSA